MDTSHVVIISVARDVFEIIGKGFIKIHTNKHKGSFMFSWLTELLQTLLFLK